MPVSKRTIVVGHGDDPALLRRNIEHHLSIGFDAVVVATAFDDPEASAVVAAFASECVVAHSPDPATGDPFLYFDEAAAFARERFASERIAFVDTDEFIVSRTGSIERTAASERYDLVVIARHNVVPRRAADGTLEPLDLTQPLDLPVFDSPQPISSQWSGGDRSTPYVYGRDAAKLYTRTRYVDGLQTGAHGIKTYASFVTRTVDEDLAIVHLPFTTLKRFERKVEHIVRGFRKLGHRLQPHESWHWRHWATLDAEGIRREFELQVHDAREAGGRHLTTTRELLAAAPALTMPLTPGAWTALHRAVGYLPHAYPHVPPPAWHREIFDPAWYADRYSDVRASVDGGLMDSESHYLRYGGSEGRSPSARFDAAHIREALQRRAGDEIDPHDIFWLYFDLEPSQRPSPVPRFALEAH